MSDVAKTPREELECKKKYLYEYSMFWECNDGSKCQILEEDVVRLLNEQQATISKLEEENEQLRQQLAEKEQEERLYAQEIVKLNKEAKEVLNFRNLGSDY